jgi:integrase
MIAVNPTLNVDLPKKLTPEMNAMNQEEVARFRAVAKHSKWYILFELMLGTGLRPSEALGLSWRNVDLASGKIRVVQKLSRKNKKEWKFDPPKSEKGKRPVTLPATLITLLSQHMDEQSKSGLPNPYNLVFPAFDGEPAYGNSISQNVFRPLLEKAKLGEYVKVTNKHGKEVTRFISRFCLYDLRHTHATLLLLAGKHPQIMQERLGHGSIKITMDTYSHVLPDMQAGAAESVEELIYSVPSPVLIEQTGTPRVQN